MFLVSSGRIKFQLEKEGEGTIQRKGRQTGGSISSCEEEGRQGQIVKDFENPV